MSETDKSQASTLILRANLASPDDFYEELINLHQGLTDEQSASLNSKLVLILANHVGDMQVIREAFALAGKNSPHAS